MGTHGCERNGCGTILFETAGAARNEPSFAAFAPDESARAPVIEGLHLTVADACRPAAENRAEGLSTRY